jgi:aryl-alcohol dehydrogenase-like predicted oxidoreductase
MGLLSGKYSTGARLTGTDVRASSVPWLKYFKQGAANDDYLVLLRKVEPLLTTNGRSLSQGALSWILAASDRAIPLPGFTATAQIRDNLGALTHGRLPADVMVHVRRIVSEGLGA